MIPRLGLGTYGRTGEAGLEAITAALELPSALNLNLGGVENASLSVLRPLDPAEGGFRVEVYNDTGHLDGLMSPWLP